MTFVRMPAVAGTFYPAEPDALRRQLVQFLSEADNTPPTGAATTLPKAIIGPHAGYIYSGSVAARAYARLAAARGRISRVVLIGPSHHVAFQGLAVDTADAWSLPSGTVALDTEAIAQLRQLPMVGTLAAAYAKEHALEVHVPFLQQVLGDFRLVPIVAGDTPAEAVAAVFDSLWGGPETLFVISTDLSHYLDYAACQEIDQRTAEAIERFDADALTPTGACGCVPTRGLLLSARRRGMAIERLDLRNSGDTAGPRDRVVGYGAWALFEPGSTGATIDPEHAAVEAVAPILLQVVRNAIGIGFNSGQPPQVIVNTTLPPLLADHGAAFVTLRRHGTLRGCIGSPAAWRPLIEDVAHHAFNAAFKDPRFPPLGLLELQGLDLSISVLTPPQPMVFGSEADLLAQLRPRVDGLIIDDSGRRSLFLPSVWEEIADPRMFLAQLKMKAGMAADHFSPRFTAQRFRSIEVKGRMLDRGPGAGPVALASAADHLGWTPIARRGG
ncbi:MAG TPA: AmmeMemoRadiSam system protein B [Acetobacteraceae bacterium]